MLILSDARCCFDPGFRFGAWLEGFERPAPIQVGLQIVGGDAVESAHPFLEPAMVRVDVVDVELRLLGAGRCHAELGLRSEPVARITGSG